MGLITLLYAVNDAVIVPGERGDTSFDFRKQTIAETAYRIPLPWLAMFRREDLQTAEIVFDEDGETQTQVAPVTSMRQAKENLVKAERVVGHAFPQCPMLGTYFEIMVEELAQFPFPFVTIDASQLYPEMLDRGGLPDPWSAVLAGFESPEAAEEFVPRTLGDRVAAMVGRKGRGAWLRAINRFVEFEPADSLVHADYERMGGTATSEEIRRHAILLPGGEYHESAWNSGAGETNQIVSGEGRS